MIPRNDSYTYTTSFKKDQNSKNNADKYNTINLKSKINNNNTLTNSYQIYNRTHKYFNADYNSTFSTPRKNEYKANWKTIQANNKDNSINEDIKKIIEVIEGIKENQNEIISVIKGLKSNKEINNNISDNKSIPKEEESDKKNGKENNLLYSFNKENDSFQNELSILKKKEEENQKLIESNKIEIENLKKKFQNNINNENFNTIIEKDKKIKELEELLKKSKDENSELKQKLSKSESLNDQKDEEINSLKNKIKEFKGKSVINDLEPKKLSDILNNMKINIDLIKNSLPNNNAVSMIDNMTKSISTFNEKNYDIKYENGEFK